MLMRMLPSILGGGRGGLPVTEDKGLSASSRVSAQEDSPPLASELSRDGKRKSPGPVTFQDGPAVSCPPEGSPAPPLARPPEGRSQQVPRDLRELVWWREKCWQGPSPVDTLTQWLAAQKLPEAQLEVRETKLLQPPAYVALCVLPHLGVQISPERLFPTSEAAKQNSSLAAILLLEGALGGDSGGLVSVSKPGSTPRVLAEADTPSPFALTEAKRLLQMKAARLKKQQDFLDREYELKKGALGREAEEVVAQLTLLGEGGEKAGALLARFHKDCTLAAAATPLGGVVTPALGTSHPQKKRPRNGEQGSDSKNPIMELKELCDRRRWQQPLYEFAKSSMGHVARISVPDGDLANLLSEPLPSVKAAKANAATRALKALLGVQGFSLQPVNVGNWGHSTPQPAPKLGGQGG